jgi:TolB-like protein
MSETIGHYRIVREIGRGGMGIVYEAIDERLRRPIAIKKLLPASDPSMRDRFLREARAAAAVNHPHICQLFEIAEHDGDPFLAMELLEGQSLASRLEEGPIPAADAITIALAILSALEALHRREFVHRDLKPSNVFLTAHGAKLLDFGLARPVTLGGETGLVTLPGIILGTPRYMAPEQARGEDVDARADLFAVGAVLFEMISGRPAFTGDSAVEALHSVLHDQPPAIVGSPAALETDLVIQRALAKRRDDRYPSARDMATALRTCQSRTDFGGAAVAHATLRLIVLPFRLLRPDPAIDFLAFSLPDAMTVTLSGIQSLVVRSSFVAAKFADGYPDLRSLASEAAVDVAVTGTLLLAGGVVRVSVQLIETPSGTVRWSHAWQVPLDDLFQIQESVCSAVVDALALPLSSHEQRLLGLDVPANAEAYSHYLRANQLSATSSHWTQALAAYQRAVDADPTYAPAWARLGRCLRIMGKYGHGPDAHVHTAHAEEAFQRAFRINPDLSLAHNLYTFAEVDSGRAMHAVLRLLGRIREHTSDPELYAGLVQACRYVGLIDASIAAYRRASRLDPSTPTSVAHSYYMNGEYDRALETAIDDPPYMSVLALLSLGRTDEALTIARGTRSRTAVNTHLAFLIDGVIAIVERRFEEGRAIVSNLLHYPAFSDPEGFYYWAQAFAFLEDPESALTMLTRAVNSGLHCVRGLETPPAFDRLRQDPRFGPIVERAQSAHAIAARAFADAGGHRLLGLPIP